MARDAVARSDHDERRVAGFPREVSRAVALIMLLSLVIAVVTGILSIAGLVSVWVGVLMAGISVVAFGALRANTVIQQRASRGVLEAESGRVSAGEREAVARAQANDDAAVEVKDEKSGPVPAAKRADARSRTAGRVSVVRPAARSRGARAVPRNAYSGAGIPSVNQLRPQSSTDVEAGAEQEQKERTVAGTQVASKPRSASGKAWEPVRVPRPTYATAPKVKREIQTDGDLDPKVHSERLKDPSVTRGREILPAAEQLAENSQNDATARSDSTAKIGSDRSSSSSSAMSAASQQVPEKEPKSKVDSILERRRAAG